MDLTELTHQFNSIALRHDDEIDVARAVLHIAATEYPALNFQYELVSLNALADGVSYRVVEEEDPLYKLNTISEYLFDELGFRGNREDYYDPRNSFLNQVMNRRLGNPITLSLVYIEIGQRLGIPLVGVGIPGHFLVKHLEVEDIYVDPFNGGILLSQEECIQRVRDAAHQGLEWNPKLMTPVTNREFVARMLRNLKTIYLRQRDFVRALTMVDWLVRLQPEQEHEVRDRGLMHYRLGNFQRAQEDLEDYLAAVESDEDAEAVRGLINHINKMQET